MTRIKIWSLPSSFLCRTLALLDIKLERLRKVDETIAKEYSCCNFVPIILSTTQVYKKEFLNNFRCF